MHRQRAWTISGHHGKSCSPSCGHCCKKHTLIYRIFVYCIPAYSHLNACILTRFKLICFLFKQLLLRKYQHTYCRKTSPICHIHKCMYMLDISLPCVSQGGLCFCVRSESNSITGFSQPCCQWLRTAWWMWLIYRNNFHTLWKTPAIISFVHSLIIHSGSIQTFIPYWFTVFSYLSIRS